MKSLPKKDEIEQRFRRYCLYRRVSSSDQVDRYLSLPQQANEQRDYVNHKGGIIVAEFEDGGITGATDDRDEFQAMVALAKERGFDVLLVHKSDRAFRKRNHAHIYKTLLKQHGVSLESVTEPWFGGDSATDRLTEGMMECFSEFYLDNLSEEVKKGIRSAARNHGRQQGRPPYGYWWAQPGVRGAGWAVDETAAVWVKWIFEQIADYAKTNSEICRELNAMGVVSPGKKMYPGRTLVVDGWNPEAVRTISENAVYLGNVRNHDAYYDGAHESLIEQDLFDRTQAVRARGGERKSNRGQGILGGGLLVCPHCWEEKRRSKLTTHASISRSLTQRKIYHYQCVYREKIVARIRLGNNEPPCSCPGYNVSQIALLDHIRAALRPVLRGVNVAEVLKTLPPKPVKIEQTSREASATRAMIEREIGNLPKLRSAYQEQQALGAMTIQELIAKLADLEQRQQNFEAQLAALVPNKTSINTQASLSSACQVIDTLDNDQLTPAQKRDRLKQHIDFILPRADKQGVTIVWL